MNLKRSLFALAIFAIAGLLALCKKPGIPPDTPVITSGPEHGGINASYEFAASATHPGNEQIAIRFDWGNGDSSYWSVFIPSGDTVRMSNTWTSPGTYVVKALAKVEAGAESDWSDPHSITIMVTLPQPPNTPQIVFGPSHGGINVSYEFAATATHPDNEQIAIRFDWGNGDTSNWSAFIPSGDSVSASHTWANAGTYRIRTQARNEDGLTSDWSEPHEIIISTNRPPNTPDTPIGPDSCRVGVFYSFSSSATDPDGDSVAIRFDWGDGDTSAWSNLVPSGQNVTVRHSWHGPGTYGIRAQASDGQQAISGWSVPWSVRVDTNAAPGRPSVPNGPHTGVPGRTYHFTSTAVDPESDSICIRFSWGDGDTSGWSAFVASGETIPAVKAWLDTGRYMVRAQAQDRLGSLSVWSPVRPIRINHYLWRFPVSSGVASSPAIGPDRTIYVGDGAYSGGNSLYAINPDGTMRWRYQVCNYEGVSSSPAIGADGIILVGSGDGYIHAIDTDGTMKWRYQTGAWVVSSPAIAADGVVYIGSADCHLHAINPDGTMKWRYQTGDEVSSSPAIGADGIVYIGSADHHLHAINPDGTLRWRYRTGGPIVLSSPAIATDGTVYVGSDDYHLYALNPNGTLRWRYQTNGSVWSSPAIAADGTVYVGSDGLYAINPDGTLRWRYQTGDRVRSSPAIAADGTVYVGSYDRYLYAINPDGTLRWRYQTGGGIRSSPAIAADGTVYVGSDDGYLYAIEGDSPLAESPWPKFRHDMKNTGRVGGGW